MQYTASIDRRYQLPYEDFVDEYLFPNKPVIITGAIDCWKALHTWTPEYFKNKYGSVNVRIDAKNYTISDFIDHVNSSSPENPAPYLRNEIIHQFLPELLADISPLPLYFFPNWLDGRLSRVLRSRLHNGSPELYIGGSGSRFPFLHFDTYHTHAFLAQIYGIKEFTAFTPDQTPCLYVRPNRYNASQIPNIENPDLTKFPLFANAVPIRFRLHAGELLFIPGGL